MILALLWARATWSQQDTSIKVILEQHRYLMSQQQLILDQLKLAISARNQSITDTQRLNEMERRVAAMETAEKEHIASVLESAPQSIAVLQSRVTVVNDFIAWILGILSTAIIGGGAMFFRSLREITATQTASRIAEEKSRAERHNRILDGLETLQKAVQIATDEVNTIKRAHVPEDKQVQP